MFLRPVSHQTTYELILIYRQVLGRTLRTVGTPLPKGWMGVGVPGSSRKDGLFDWEPPVERLTSKDRHQKGLLSCRDWVHPVGQNEK